MILYREGLPSGYEIEMLSRMFFPALTLAGDRTPFPPPPQEDWLLVRAAPDGLSVVLSRGGTTLSERSSAVPGEEQELALARMLFRCAVKSGCAPLRWGVLTGVRPIKLFHRMAAQGLDDAQQAALMRERYLLDDAMISLAQEIRRSEQAINDRSLPNGFSLYVSIPFCPQRCSYCSFVSQEVERMRELIGPYVEQLCGEIGEFGGIARDLGLTLQTVYFGGGTPTTLDAQQLSSLFRAVEKSFDLSCLLEYTVEAGRPDTIDRERLLACKSAGVTRLSVNPQSMNDEVLAAVGRRHTAADVERAFELVRSISFGSVNMDLIAGLPGESVESFSRSLERVLALGPDNVTVHALTLKRASTLAQERELYERREQVAAMVDHARERIRGAGLAPYYLYRQKNTIGSLDNTGYALPGKEGFYNVFIMDETHTIFAAGAGAVTKLRAPCGDTIERIYNYKFPSEYLAHYAALKERKERVKRFYETHQQTEKFHYSDI